MNEMLLPLTKWIVRSRFMELSFMHFAIEMPMSHSGQLSKGSLCSPGLIPCELSGL